MLRQQPFYANASSREAVAAFLGRPPARGPRRPREPAPATRDAIIANAVRGLACAPDWNEHLTPQARFFPRGFPETAVVAPATALAEVLPAAAAAARLSEARAAAAISSTSKNNARDGWPQRADLFPALARYDAAAKATTSTGHIWCWIHARDYAAFWKLFPPPAECDAAWAAARTRLPKRS